MFRINKEKNTVESLEQPKFSDLGFKERENLQEWICHNPEMFGEPGLGRMVRDGQDFSIL
jgi:hypothetical protein